jgi:transcriptional regulator with XRE-family HTH domain
MNTQNVLGSRMKKRRKELHMNQEELAQKVNVARQTISSWERGDFPPTQDKLMNIANALDTKVGYLIGETDDSRNLPDLPIANISVTKDLKEISGTKDSVNTIGDGNTIMPIPTRNNDIKGLGYWGDVVDEAQKVAERRRTDEIKRVTFILEEALQIVKDAGK